MPITTNNLPNANNLMDTAESLEDHKTGILYELL